MGKGSCGRAACTLAPPQIQEATGAKAFIGRKGFESRPRYNCGPGANLPVLLCAPPLQDGKSDLQVQGEEEEDKYVEGELIIRTMRWGLVPFFTKADWAADACKEGWKMINARSDNLHRVHKRLLDTRRCAVFIEGFYEWLDDKKTGKKRPYFIRRKDQRPMLLAGLYDTWRGGADGKERIISCTVVTTDSNNELAWLHDRMPAILEGQRLDDWLDNGNVGFEDPRIQAILRPYNGNVDFYEVSNTVGNIKNNTAECMMPLSLFKEKQFASGLGKFFSPQAKTEPEGDGQTPAETKAHAAAEGSAGVGGGASESGGDGVKAEADEGGGASGPVHAEAEGESAAPQSESAAQKGDSSTKEPVVDLTGDDSSSASPTRKRQAPAATGTPKKAQKQGATGKKEEKDPAKDPAQTSITSFLTSPKKK